MSTQLSYHLDFSDFNNHFVSVTISLMAPHDNPTFYLPTWIAGSYLIREFAKNIDAVTYVCQGQQHRAQKLSKNIWQIWAQAQQQLTIYYRVYCYDLSVRTAYIDNTRLFGNFSALLLMPQNTPNHCSIELCVPKRFLPDDEIMLATGLPFCQINQDVHTIYRLDAPKSAPFGVMDIYDYPFEIAAQDGFDFVVHHNHSNIPHRFFVSGVCQYNQERLKTDLQKICQSYVNLLNWVPFDDYTFMTHATLNDYGGLEHINSTALITPRDDLPKINEPDLPSKSYQRFLGLCSHEYFHAWWVKSVRPDVMMDNDLQHEAYTPLLWVFEGFTSYVDDLMLYVSQVIDKTSYLNLLAEQITRLHNTTGRQVQTLAESSFDSWIKLYRPDENSTNSTVSYYNKGALVALGLDLLLRQYGAKLFDVIKLFIHRAQSAPNQRFGMTCDNLDEAIVRFLPKDVWQDFKDNYIHGTTELPLESWLSYADITLHQERTLLPYGLTTEEADGKLVIKNSHPDNQNNGLSAKDVIVSINGLKPSTAYLKTLACTNQTVLVEAFRRDVLMTFVLSPAPIFTVVKTHLSGSGAGWLD